VDVVKRGEKGRKLRVARTAKQHSKAIKKPTKKRTAGRTKQLMKSIKKIIKIRKL